VRARVIIVALVILFGMMWPTLMKVLDAYARRQLENSMKELKLIVDERMTKLAGPIANNK